MLVNIGLPLLLLLATLAICDPEGHPWRHPLPTDRKGEVSHMLLTIGSLLSHQAAVHVPVSTLSPTMATFLATV